MKLVLESEGVTLNTETLLTIAEDHPHPQTVRDSGEYWNRAIFEANLLDIRQTAITRREHRVVFAYHIRYSASIGTAEV